MNKAAKVLRIFTAVFLGLTLSVITPVQVFAQSIIRAR